MPGVDKEVLIRRLPTSTVKLYGDWCCFAIIYLELRSNVQAIAHHEYWKEENVYSKPSKEKNISRQHDKLSEIHLNAEFVTPLSQSQTCGFGI